jgi:protein phosphatase 1 regulatory subunit 7
MSAPSEEAVDETAREEEEVEETTVEVEETVEEAEEGVQEAVQEERTVRRATAPLPLDWTRIQQKEGDEPVVRYPWNVWDIDKEEDELCIVGTAGQKITKMGVELGDYCNPKLKKLILRSSLIKTMEGIDTFEELELLELYDNMIDALSSLNEGANGSPGMTLKTLDMSYNVIRDMSPVSFCPNLRELYIANNKIKTISGLSELKCLVKIDLGANKIRVIEGLDGLINLEELWLGKNKIEQIAGIEKLTKLRRLDVQSNRLTFVANLESQKDTLEELYLGHNGITDEGASQPTGLALNFTQLTTLDLSRNFMTSTQPLAHLVTLNDLWMSGNKIESFDQVSYLSSLTELDTIYLEYNPIGDDFEYRMKVKKIMPSLNQIDATLIRGLAMHGMASMSGGGVAETHEEKMRRLQDIVIRKAQAETARAKQEQKDGDAS